MTKTYIHHRLKVIGYDGSMVFQIGVVQFPGILNRDSVQAEPKKKTGNSFKHPNTGL